MLFLVRVLFRGHNGSVVRAIFGAVLLVIGIAVHGAPIFAGTGVVLIVWGGTGALSDQRARRQAHLGTGGRM
jgi:membrane-bound ClpP family serine protease